MREWSENSLDFICEIIKGEQLNKLDLEKSGEFPCINGGIEPSGYTDKWNRLENTITISEGGNSCGYVNFLKTKFWSGGHCYSLQNIKDGFDLDFLYYALKGNESKIMGLRVGSGLPNIQQKAVKAFEIKYPKDKPEQTRIAEILLTTDEAITQTEALIAKYQRIKTGLIQDLLTKGIDEKGNIRSKETHKFEVKNGIEVPVEWEVDNLSTYSNLHNSLRKPISAIERYQNQGSFPYYGATGIIDYINEFRVDGEFVLIGEDGDHYLKFESQEMTHLVNGKFNVSNHAHIISGKDDCSTKWIHYFFSHRDITYYLTRQGAGRFKLNKATLQKLPVCVPSPEEQSTIIERIETFNESFNLEKEKLQKLNAIKTGLMQDLLSGNVRVNMDNKN